MSGKILVLGATGQVGRTLIPMLRSAGEEMRAASRGGERVQGAEGVRFDFDEPATFWPALEGCDRVYAVVPTDTLDPVATLLPVIEACVECKLKVVLQSVYALAEETVAAYREIEAKLAGSGIPHVVLRPGWFADNFHNRWKDQVADGCITLPAAQGKSGFIDVRDIARCAVSALVSDRFDGRTFELTGPELLTYGEAADILSGVLGRPIRYRALTDDAFVELLKEGGADEDIARFTASVFKPVRDGEMALLTNAVEELTGAAPRAFVSYAYDHRNAMSAAQPSRAWWMPRGAQAGHGLGGAVALVTGGSSGIGRETARAMALAGAAVALTYRSGKQAAEEVAHEIEAAGGRAVILGGDVSQEGDVAAFFDATAAEFGRVDVLVSNSGIQKDASVGEMELDDWRRVLDVNLTGQFLCCREAIRRFRAQPRHGRPMRALGSIISMSSVHEVIPWAGHVNYAAAKGGLRMMVRSLSQEVAREGIRVNAIAPGAVRTPINRESWDDPDALSELLKLVPYGRIGEVEDIARAAVWLASDDADYVNGTTLFVDGGMTLYPGFVGNG